MFEVALSPTVAARQEPALGLLRSIDWLGGVTPATMERLADQALLIRLPRGSRIFEQAEVPTFAEFVLGGSIELLAVRDEEETLVEIVRPPDMLLPAAMLGSLPYLVRACVREDALLLLVPAAAFRAAVAADHGLALAVLACQAMQFRRQMKQAKAIRLRTAEERVGAYMLALAESTPESRQIRLPLEKRQIAAQLAMTRETLSRALPTLSRHGLNVIGDLLRVSDIAKARLAFPFDPLIDGRDEIRPLIPGVAL